MKIALFFAALFLLDLFTCDHAYPQYPLPDIEDPKFIEDCLRTHNKFRSKVNPPASNMFCMSLVFVSEGTSNRYFFTYFTQDIQLSLTKAADHSLLLYESPPYLRMIIFLRVLSALSSSSVPLLKSWDAALAKTAKAWAKKCKFKHNIYLKMPRKVHPTFTPVGENIWTGTATIFSVDAALSDWFDEVSSYDFSTNRCTGMCGHFTQVVWAESYKVGCAVHFCNAVEYFPGLFRAAHFVCNYGPAGNYPRKPYKAGQPCSGCSNEKCVDKLCENTEREKLIDYTYWYPDWDTQPQPPRPRPPRPPTPPHIPPAGHPRPSCDQYCISVSILRPLFLVLSAGAVLLVQQRFPHMFFYE